MDSFTFGKAARQGPNLGRKPIYVLLAVVVLGGLGWGIVSVTKTGGEAVAEHVKDTTKQIDVAGDLQAQTNLRLAMSAATTAFMDGGSFAAASADELSAIEPAVRYVDGSQRSNGPSVISVQATDQAWGGAVLSSSGTCFYLRTVGTTQAYGNGDADVCTGAAAMGATGSDF